LSWKLTDELEFSWPSKNMSCMLGEVSPIKTKVLFTRYNILGVSIACDNIRRIS
jgi:hypothetical protein